MVDLVTADYALKQHYQNYTPNNVYYKNNPLYAITKKYTKFTGSVKPVPQIYSNPQGRSATFSNALAQAGNTKGVKFMLTRVPDYGVVEIGNEAMLASMDDAGSFVELATQEIDGGLVSVGRSIATAMYRDGTGTIGRISSGSTVASLNITLATLSDADSFEVGMTIGASSGLGTGERTGSAQITAINRDTGTLTTAGSNWSAQITSLAVNDYLFVKGDFNKKLSGLDAWVPLTAPSATAFFGVDRTSDITRLAGVRKSLIGLPIAEALTNLITATCKAGATTDLATMNFENYAALENQLGSKVQYSMPIKDSEGIIAFDGIKVMGLKGPVTVLPDVNCQSDRIYAIQKDTWQLSSLGEAPSLFDSDGQKMLRSGTADSLQVRMNAYLNLECTAVGWNGVGQIA